MNVLHLEFDELLDEKVGVFVVVLFSCCVLSIDLIFVLSS